jgi:hypothetical protein
VVDRVDEEREADDVGEQNEFLGGLAGWRVTVEGIVPVARLYRSGRRQ